MHKLVINPSRHETKHSDCAAASNVNYDDYFSLPVFFLSGMGNWQHKKFYARRKLIYTDKLNARSI